MGGDVSSQACRYCGEPVDRLQPGYKTGDAMYCSQHHALADRDPLVIGTDALEYAEWLNGLTPDDVIRWPWHAVNELAGPLVPGRVTYVAAFPGGGKTTFLTHCLASWLAQGKRVLYMPLEADPGEVYARLACLKLGLSADDVLSLRLRMWASSGDAVAARQLDALTAEYHRMRLDVDLMRALRIEPVDALNITAFHKAVSVAKAADCDLVCVDHVDHSEGEDGELSAGIAISDKMQTIALRAAKHLKIPFVLASQLNSSRTGGDHLAPYRPPVTDWLYNKGKKDQVAAIILGLSRMLNPDVDMDWLKEVKLGTRDVSTIVLPERMAVTGMKLRYGSGTSTRSVALAYKHGVIRDLDEMERRDGESSAHGIGTGSPSNRYGRAA